jgi:hypothetical protein
VASGGAPVDYDEYVPTVKEALEAETRAEFDRRAREQAAAIIDDCAAGRLDSADFAVGLELEANVVDAEGRPRPVPQAVLDLEGTSPELARHNVELHTEPDVLDAAGLRRQKAELEARERAVRAALADGDLELVFDAMWAVPHPAGTRQALGDVVERDGLRFARNMTPNGRYYAIDNDILRRVGGDVAVSLPGIESVPTILVESLATSIQPHLQIPVAGEVHRYLAYAIRTLGPVTALATNSPFLPADCYSDVDPETALDAPLELRVPVFERSVNAGLSEAERMCRVPADVSSAREALDRIVSDVACGPVLSESGDPDGPYGQRHPEFRAKRGTFWRWVRPVVGGDVPRGGDGEPAPGNSTASVRIEYRPLATQPTVADIVGFQALVAGLLSGLAAADHPLVELPWAAARDSFYRAVADGPTADLAWVTDGGEWTDDRARIYEEAFGYARRGLSEAGLDAAAIDDLLGPVEARWAAGATPATWKRDRVRDRVDGGASLPEAIEATYREFARHARETDSFVAFPGV